MSNNFCARCGAVIEDGVSYDFNGETYCERCYQDETVACSHCGKRTLREYITQVSAGRCDLAGFVFCGTSLE